MNPKPKVVFVFLFFQFFSLDGTHFLIWPHLAKKKQKTKKQKTHQVLGSLLIFLLFSFVKKERQPETLLLYCFLIKFNEKHIGKEIQRNWFLIKINQKSSLHLPLSFCIVSLLNSMRNQQERSPEGLKGNVLISY